MWGATTHAQNVVVAEGLSRDSYVLQCFSPPIFIPFARGAAGLAEDFARHDDDAEDDD